MSTIHSLPTAAATLSRHAKAEIITWRAADALGDARGAMLARERIAVLEDRASLHTADDAEGALFQMAVLAGLVERHMPDDDVAEEALRLIASLAVFLERAHGAQRGAFAGYYFSETNMVASGAA